MNQIACVVIQIVAAILEKDADRLRLGLADEDRELVAAPQPDIGADCAEDTAKAVRPLPRRSKRRDGATAVAGNRPVVRDPRSASGHASSRFTAAVRRAGTVRSRRSPSRIRSCGSLRSSASFDDAFTRPCMTNTPTIGGIVLLVNEVVEDHGSVVLKAVLEDHYRRGLRAIELLGDVAPSTRARCPDTPCSDRTLP